MGPTRGGGFFLKCRSILVDESGFGRGSMFGVFGFGPAFGPFLAKHVQSSGFLEGFQRVRSSVLVDKPGFESV